MVKPIFDKDGIVIYQDNIMDTLLIPESSVDLIVTSPPYNLAIEYNSSDDKKLYSEYLKFSEKWMRKCYALIKDDGRFCLNIPLTNNKNGIFSVGSDLTTIAKDIIGWNYHTTIVWHNRNVAKRTAWGSWLSASAPYVIAPVEIIVILYKNHWKKQNAGVSNIEKNEFMAWTNGMWEFGGQTKKEVGGHPAPFPIELPKRCIKLFSYVDDVVLDPFLGSGTTLVASKICGRKAIGIDIDTEYCQMAVNRLNQYDENLFGEMAKVK